MLHNFHDWLKTLGIVVSHSSFDRTLKEYYQDGTNWDKSKSLLGEILAHACINNITLIVYKFPEMHLIEHLNIPKGR